MDKKYLDRLMPYLINNHEDGYYLSDGNGFLLESDALLDIGQNLIKFAKKHKKDIEEANKIRKQDFENEIKEFSKKEKLKFDKKGQIYIMECGGYYKIGVSKNVERRQKQLNNRPFKVNIIYKSPIIDDCYGIENDLHSMFKNAKIDGEWFNLTQNDIEYIKRNLETYNEIYD